MRKYLFLFFLIYNCYGAICQNSNPNAIALLQLKYTCDTLYNQTLDLQNELHHLSGSPITMTASEYDTWKKTTERIEHIIEKVSFCETIFENYLQLNSGEIDVKYKIAYCQLIKILIYKNRNEFFLPLKYYSESNGFNFPYIDSKIQLWEIEEKRAKIKTEDYLNRLSPDDKNSDYKVVKIIYGILTSSSIELYIEPLNNLKAEIEIDANLQRGEKNRYISYLSAWLCFLNYTNYHIDEFKMLLDKVKLVDNPASIGKWGQNSFVAYNKKKNDGFDTRIAGIKIPDMKPYNKQILYFHTTEPYPKDKRYFYLQENGEYTITKIDSIIARYNNVWDKLIAAEMDPGRKYSTILESNIAEPFEDPFNSYYLDDLTKVKNKKIRDIQCSLYKARFENMFEVFNELHYLKKCVSELIKQNTGFSLKYIRLNINLGLAYIAANVSTYISFFDIYKIDDELIDQGIKAKIEVMLLASPVEELDIDIKALEKTETDNPLYKLALAQKLAYSNDPITATVKLEKLINETPSNIKIGNQELKKLIAICRIYIYLINDDFDGVKKDIELIKGTEAYQDYNLLIKYNTQFINEANRKQKLFPFYIKKIPFKPFMPQTFPLAYIAPPPILINDNFVLENRKGFKKLRIGIADLADKAAGKNRDLCTEIRSQLYSLFADSLRFEIIDADEISHAEENIFSKEYNHYLNSDSLTKDGSFLAFKSKFAIQQPEEFQKKMSQMFQYTDVMLTGSLNSVLAIPNIPLGRKANVEFQLWAPEFELKELKKDFETYKLEFNYAWQANGSVPQIKKENLSKIVGLTIKKFPLSEINSNNKIVTILGQTITMNIGKNLNIHPGDKGCILKLNEYDNSDSKMRLEFIVTAVKDYSCEANLIIKADDDLEPLILKTIRPKEMVWFK